MNPIEIGTLMTELTPETQAVVNAYDQTTDKYAALAAVLRALVNIVAPEDYDSYQGNGDYDEGMEDRNREIRDEILNVCNELEKI